MNPHQELGISPGASKKVIQTAYRSLAFRWHPDRCKKPGAEDKMKILNRAYEMLMHPERQPTPITRQQPVYGTGFGFWTGTAGAASSTSNQFYFGNIQFFPTA